MTNHAQLDASRREPHCTRHIPGPEAADVYAIGNKTILKVKNATVSRGFLMPEITGYGG